MTGVDPATRLLGVAGERARAEGLRIELSRGEAGSPPLPESSVDVAVSNFGPISAPDPQAAVAELMRVLRP